MGTHTYIRIEKEQHVEGGITQRGGGEEGEWRRPPSPHSAWAASTSTGVRNITAGSRRARRGASVTHGRGRIWARKAFFLRALGRP